MHIALDVSLLPWTGHVSYGQVDIAIIVLAHSLGLLLPLRRMLKQSLHVQETKCMELFLHNAEILANKLASSELALQGDKMA